MNVEIMGFNETGEESSVRKNEELEIRNEFVLCDIMAEVLLWHYI